MSICVVILHYGNPALSLELARTLRMADAARSAHIRIFDNAAPSPCPDAFARAEQNLFWGGALCRCLELAEQEGFSHLWFLNNDIRFLSPPSLTALEARIARLDKAFARPVGLWSPAVAVNPYHPHMCPSGELHALRRVRLLDCVAPLLRLEAVQDAGGLDSHDNPKGYGTDMWLSWRVSEKGWPVLVDQDIVIRHRPHTSAKGIAGFLEEAAVDEADFCARRFGPHWRTLLKAQKERDSQPAALIRPFSSGV